MTISESDIAKAILLVQLEMQNRFDQWNRKNKYKDASYSAMEDTYELVQEYLAGMFKDVTDKYLV